MCCAVLCWGLCALWQEDEQEDEQDEDSEFDRLQCNYYHCKLDRKTSLRECKKCGAMHHHICAINWGQEEMTTLCAKCFGLEVYKPNKKEHDEKVN